MIATYHKKTTIFEYFFLLVLFLFNHGFLKEKLFVHKAHFDFIIQFKIGNIRKPLLCLIFQDQELEIVLGEDHSVHFHRLCYNEGFIPFFLE